MDVCTPAVKQTRKAEDPSATSAADLMRAESRKLKLVGNAQMGSAIARAVRHGLEKHFLVEQDQLEAAVNAIGRELFQQLKANSKSVRGLPKKAFLREVEADKQRIEEESARARQELEELLNQLEHRNQEAGLKEAELVRKSQEQSFDKDRALADEITRLFAECNGPEDFERIRERITLLSLDSVQGEREQAIEAQMADYKAQAEKFQRRIGKLTNSLELTEEELRRVAAAKHIDLGVQSIYRTVQGLGGDEENLEVKKELMSSIFQANLELQKGPRP